MKNVGDARLELQPLAHALLPQAVAHHVPAVHSLHRIRRLPQAIQPETDPEGCACNVLPVRALQQRARLVHFAGGAVFDQNFFEFEEQGAVVLVQGVLPRAAAGGGVEVKAVAAGVGMLRPSFWQRSSESLLCITVACESRPTLRALPAALSRT